MVSIKSVACNNCGASISIDPDRPSSFCPYCGTQLIYDDGVSRAEINTNTNIEINQRIYQYDEAKIREIEYQKAIDARIDNKKSRQRKVWMWTFIIFAVIFLVMGIVSAVLWNSYTGIALLLLILIVVGIATLIAVFLTYYLYKFTEPMVKNITTGNGIFEKHIQITETPADRVRKVWKAYFTFLLVVGFISFYAFMFLVAYK